jgi:hypothetical protein
LDDLWTKSIGDHDAVDIARVEVARRRFDAQRAHEADALPDRGGEGRVGAASPHAQDSCLFEQLRRQGPGTGVLGCGTAPKHGCVQRSHAQR